MTTRAVQPWFTRLPWPELGAVGVLGALTLPFAPVPEIAWTALVALLLVVILGRPWWQAGVARRLPSTTGVASPGRDLAVDLLRGLAIAFVVIDHVELPSLYYMVSQQRLGVFTGAELFVLLSGTVFGLTARRRAATHTWPDEARRALRRAGTLYVTALAVTLIAYLVSDLPGLNHAALTTYTEQGTTYVAYQTTGSPWDFLGPLLRLKGGPWPLNILGLYVVLLLLTPPLIWLLRRGGVAWLLAGSWLVYALYTLHPVRLIPSEFSSSFPLLAWQVLYAHGLALGYHRDEVRRWLQTPRGHLLLVAAGIVCVLLAVYAWTDPHKFFMRLPLLSPETYDQIHMRFFERGRLGPGRLLNVGAFAVVALTLLERNWAVIARPLGTLLVPVGQATLYVYVLQVFAVLLVASMPVLGHSVLIGTHTHTALLLGLGWAVRRETLFRWIPR